MAARSGQGASRTSRATPSSGTITTEESGGIPKKPPRPPDPARASSGIPTRSRGKENLAKSENSEKCTTDSDATRTSRVTTIDRRSKKGENAQILLRTGSTGPPPSAAAAAAVSSSATSSHQPSPPCARAPARAQGSTAAQEDRDKTVFDCLPADLQAYIRSHDLIIVEVAGAGNCFPASIADHLTVFPRAEQQSGEAECDYKFVRSRAASAVRDKNSDVRRSVMMGHAARSGQSSANATRWADQLANEIAADHHTLDYTFASVAAMTFELDLTIVSVNLSKRTGYATPYAGAGAVHTIEGDSRINLEFLPGPSEQHAVLLYTHSGVRLDCPESTQTGTLRTRRQVGTYKVLLPRACASERTRDMIQGIQLPMQLGWRPRPASEITQRPAAAAQPLPAVRAPEPYSFRVEDSALFGDGCEEVARRPSPNLLDLSPADDESPRTASPVVEPALHCGTTAPVAGGGLSQHEADMLLTQLADESPGPAHVPAPRLRFEPTMCTSSRCICPAQPRNNTGAVAALTCPVPSCQGLTFRKLGTKGPAQQLVAHLNRTHKSHPWQELCLTKLLVAKIERCARCKKMLGRLLNHKCNTQDEDDIDESQDPTTHNGPQPRLLQRLARAADAGHRAPQQCMFDLDQSTQDLFIELDPVLRPGAQSPFPPTPSNLSQLLSPSALDVTGQSPTAQQLVTPTPPQQPISHAAQGPSQRQARQPSATMQRPAQPHPASTDAAGDRLHSPDLLRADMLSATLLSYRGAIEQLQWPKIMSAQGHTTSKKINAQPWFRSAVTAVLHHVSVRVVESEPDARETWFKLLFALPKLIFGSLTPGGPAASFEDQKGRVQLLVSGRMTEIPVFAQLCDQTRGPGPMASDQQQPVPSSVDIAAAARRATEALYEGSMHKAYNIATATGEIATVCSTGDPTFQAFLRLHPNVPPLFSAFELDAEDTSGREGCADNFSAEELRQAINESHRTKAPGPSGWRVGYLQRFVSRAQEPHIDVMGSFTAAMRKLETGEGIPLSVRPLVYSALLMGLKKPDGHGVRPVAMGDVFSRMIGKAIARHYQDRFQAYFSQRNQMGVAVSGGTEAIVHAVRAAVDAEPDTVVLQLDFSNAFNTVPRAPIRSMLFKEFPELLPYFDARYSRHTSLSLLGSTTDLQIPSCTGVQQGDPLGPFFFSLALAAVTDAADPLMRPTPLPSDSPAPMFTLLLDDVTFTGPLRSTLVAANNFLETCAATLPGLRLNPAKCSLWSPGVSAATRKQVTTNVLARSFSADTIATMKFPDCAQGIVLLGAPIGSPAFVVQHIADWIDNHFATATHLNRLASAQDKTLLLRHCVASAFTYQLRTCPPSLTRAQAQRFDDQVLHLLQESQGFGFAGEPHNSTKRTTWAKVVFTPLRKGGMGISSALHTAPHAYLGSVADAAKPILSLPMFARVAPHFRAWLEQPALALDSPDPTVHDYSPRLELVRALQEFHALLAEHRTRVDTTYGDDILQRPRAIPRTTKDLIDTPRRLQHRLSTLVQGISAHRLCSDSETTPEVAAHIRSQADSLASALAHVIPSCASLRVSPEAFNAFARSRQCYDLIRADRTPCSCHIATRAAADGLGGVRPLLTETSPQHALACPHGDGFERRHNSVCATLDKVLHFMPGVLVHARYHEKSNIPGDSLPDFELTHFPNAGDHTFCEYSVVSHLQHKYIQRPSPGAAGRERDLAKTDKYREHARRANAKFFPASQEASGRGSEGMHLLLSKICERHDKEAFARTAHSRTWAADLFKRYLYQVVAIAFWSGVAAMEGTRSRLNAAALATERSR